MKKIFNENEIKPPPKIRRCWKVGGGGFYFTTGGIYNRGEFNEQCIYSPLIGISTLKIGECANLRKP